MDKPFDINESPIMPVDNMLTDRIRVIHILTVKNYQHFINIQLNNYPQNLLIDNKQEKCFLKLRIIKLYFNQPCLIVSVKRSILLLKSSSFSIFS